MLVFHKVCKFGGWMLRKGDYIRNRHGLIKIFVRVCLSMLKVLLIISGIAIVLLLIVLVILLRLNWSEKLYSPLLSLAFAAIATTLITVVLLLKEETKTKSFSTLIVVNSKTHLPAFITDQETNLTKRLNNYLILATPTEKTKGKGQFPLNSPKNKEDESIFYEELLQYAILKDIIEMHYPSQVMSQSLGKVLSNIYKPMTLTETDNKPMLKFAAEFRQNRFSNSIMHTSFLKTRYSKLPKNTEIKFNRILTSKNKEVQKHIILLQKKHYFIIEIIIESSFSTGPNSIPLSIEMDDKEAKICRTSMFSVTMTAKFERITAGNWRTEELKNWASWLFEEIERRYSDNTVDL